MKWAYERSVDEGQFTSEYLQDILASGTPRLPSHELHLGSVRGTWFEPEPGIAVIHTSGGSPDDRVLVEDYLRNWLRRFGYTQASFSLYRNQRVADWDDIQAKARRLIESGNVQLLRNGAQNIIGYVIGDHGQYQTEISREDPSSQTITQWQCECPWDQYAWQRTRQWKKYEGRPCAHVLATYWDSQRTPLDEEASPTMAQPGQQTTLFDVGTPGLPPGIKPAQPGSPPVAPPPQLSIPGVTAVPPPDPGVLPPQPGMLPEPGVVSVPGGNPGGPGNPIQHPGGTFSKVAMQFDPQLHNAAWFAARPDRSFLVTKDNQLVIGENPDVHHQDLLDRHSLEVDGVAHWGWTDEDGLANWEDYGAPAESDWHFGATFQNSDMVRINTDEWGVMEGKSEAHGAGQPKLIPRGSVGEVLGEDPTTGWVDVAFAGPQANAGPMEPYHVRAWLDPSMLTAAPEVRKPGPFIRRR